MSSAVRLEVRDRVAHLTIDRPEKRNALTADMWAALHRYLDDVDGAGVAAVVLSGAGGSFCAGADLGELRAPGRADEMRELGERAVLRLREVAVPTVAAIDGPCFGAGCSLALACDVRICSPASRFGIPALRRGLVYEQAFVTQLVRIVGPGTAGLLLYGGETWSAEEALDRGLVDRCSADVPAAVEHLLAGVRDAPAAAVAGTAAALRAAATD
ncbi:Enoyl-CoA hydratase/carnithine racemase [Pseudonocardia thermophila]|uniref:Enoyl-CoA hydratase/carnithine racemase n=1 Tax=Pseudonocardia thermophila TaxID=1848 RepID=A0A1M7BBQ9_PSETH|nr:enoyl-CoA hydratase/isomerase family protein [Pseudonocardia thermophila]SHL52357.1 Enoyl-CoA hydratase/carnithine racemase [Pseudonocardia thermophila]